jgi:NitT/TauT family transport system substrate-binding protein
MYAGRGRSLVAITQLNGGLGHVFVTYLVTALELQQPGRGCLSYLHAERGGRMANSVYYLRRERLRELTPLLAPFVRHGAMVQLSDARAHDAAS